MPKNFIQKTILSFVLAFGASSQALAQGSVIFIPQRMDFRSTMEYTCAPKRICAINNPTVNAHYAAEYLSWQTYRYRNHKNKEYCIKSAYNAGTCIRGNQKYVDRVRNYEKKYTKDK